MTALQNAPEMSLTTPLTVNQDQPEIDLMALTVAALRLVNPWPVNKSTPRQSLIETGSSENRTISLSEVSQHDTLQDCWVVIYDRVYDITTFFDEHPGGADIMLEYAGQDATTAFRGSGHSKMAVKALDRFLVGELPMHERMYRRPGGIRLSDIPE